MTNMTKRRIGAGAALAIILTGFTALSKVAQEPNSQEAAQAPRITSGDDAALISWLSRTTFPMLDEARAVPNTDVRRMVYMPPLLVRADRPTAMLEGTCEPQWASGVRGLPGRITPDLCPGKPLLPLPPLELKRSVPLDLPSLSTFNSVFENDRLNPTWLPNQGDRQQIVQELERSANAQPPESAIAGAEPVPYMNPLEWSVPKSAKYDG